MWEFCAGIEFLEFRPSEIAAAVAISVLEETRIVDTEKATSLLIQLVPKVNLVGLNDFELHHLFILSID